MWDFRSLIIPTAQVQLARDIAATLSPAGANMLLTGLSATGSAPATHYISTGLISPEFAALVPEQVWEQMALLHGYDALVILPGSKPATRSVGGRAGY